MKFAFRTAVVLFAGIALGGLLLGLVYSLPFDPIRESVDRSLSILKEEGVHPQKIVSSTNSILDNYTDATMLDLASYKSEGGLIGAMRAERAYRSGEMSDTICALEDSIRGKTGEPQGYTRYWHGYLIVLKPILYLGFDYNEIRVLNAVGQTALLLVLVVVLVAKRQASLFIPLLVTLLCIEFFVIPYSLQYSSVFYIGLITTIIVACRPAFLRKRQNAFLYFVVIGMTTSYFDFLTYPIFTFGIPSITYLYVNGFSWSGKRGVTIALSLALAWLVGYGFMWAGKWLLASIVLQEDVFTDALASMSFRTSLEDGKSNSFNYAMLFRSLLAHYREPEVLVPALAALVVYGIWLVSGIVCCAKAAFSIRSIISLFLPFAFVFVVPMVWFVLMPNHAYIHNWMTYRNLSVCIYALLVGSLHVRRRLVYKRDVFFGYCSA